VLLTDAQRAKLGVNPGDLDSSGAGAWVHRASYCGWSNGLKHPSDEYTGGLADNVGAEYSLGLEPLRSVQGFAATTAGSTGTDPRWYCGIMVDVAPGKALYATYDNFDKDNPAMNHVLACDKAQQLADAMLTTFLSVPR
jgi:hypothetical protein